MNQVKNKNAASFVQGALILGIANFIVKIIGAVFKIPLINLIEDDGMGYFNVAYQIYTFMFIVATAGFPTAISKMVSEARARGDEAEARQVFKISFRFLAVLGLIGTLILFLFAEKLAEFVKMPDASLGITAIAPAVFFVALTSAYRGYFQGRENMYPTAFSEVAESTGKMLIGLILAAFFMNMTVNPSYSGGVSIALREVASPHTRTVLASGGAIFGVTFGTLAACLLLSIIYLVHRIKNKVPKSEKSNKGILKMLVMIAIPITIGASVSSLTTLIDMGTISRRLIVRPEVFENYAFMFKEGTSFFEKAIAEGWQGAELLSQKAATLYGMYAGKALTMFNLPLTLVVALGTSIVPAISASVAKAKRLEAKTITESALRIAVLFAAPCTFGMAALSKEILNLLYSDYNAYSVLAILSFAIIPVALVQVSNSVLQAYGRVYKPVIHMIIGGTVKVLVNFFCIPYLGIDGAPVGTGICYLIIAVLNIRAIIKEAGIEFKWSSYIIRPVLAAFVMGVAGVLLSGYIPISKFGCIIEIGICAVVYALAIFAFKAVQKEDILALPKGEKIAEILEKYKLVR